MICAKHNKPYQVSCPSCDLLEKTKEDKLAIELAYFNSLSPRGAAKATMPLKWHDNPSYEGHRRDYTHGFRSTLLHALTMIDNFPYRKLIDANKSNGLDKLRQSGRLDDVFQVASTETAWTETVNALGGKQGPVYGSDGTYLGNMVSYGCTTYSRVAPSHGHMIKDDLGTMQALLNDSKVIYLHGAEVGSSTVVHELFHYFCHKEFYQAFGADGVGPEWKTLNEGITEYFSRIACKDQTRGAYQSEHETVELLLKKTSFRVDQLASAYFEGLIEPLKAVMREGEYKQEEVVSAPGMQNVFKQFTGGGGRKKV
ncbi:MAG TPA: hypothetical protein VGP07_10980 [Polyangia bacterium]|jgi:hypothetical protein